MNTNTREHWYAVKTGNHQGLVISEDTGENIAVTYKAENAQKIAAMPDLLELAEQIVRAWEDTKESVPSDIYWGAIAAIQKATEES